MRFEIDEKEVTFSRDCPEPPGNHFLLAVKRLAIDLPGPMSLVANEKNYALAEKSYGVWGWMSVNDCLIRIIARKFHELKFNDNEWIYLTFEKKEEKDMQEEKATTEERSFGNRLEDMLNDVFEYHTPSEEDIKKYKDIRFAAKNLARVILARTPPSPDQTAAIRKLRETIMTANAAVALNGRGNILPRK